MQQKYADIKLSKLITRSVKCILIIWPAYHSFFNNNRAGFPSNCNSKIFIFQSLFLGIFVTNSVMSSVTMTAFFILLTLIGHKFLGGTFLRNFNPNLPAPPGPFFKSHPRVCATGPMSCPVPPSPLFSRSQSWLLSFSCNPPIKLLWPRNGKSL